MPGTAVQRGPKGTFAYIVNEDNTVAMRTVELLSTQGDEAIIGKGLEVGEKVVTDGQNQLKPGAKIQPRTPDVKAPAASVSAPAPASPSSSGSAQGTTP